jgi:hypothetical protein
VQCQIDLLFKKSVGSNLSVQVWLHTMSLGLLVFQLQLEQQLEKRRRQPHDEKLRNMMTS